MQYSFERVWYSLKQNLVEVCVCVCTISSEKVDSVMGKGATCTSDHEHCQKVEFYVCRTLFVKKGIVGNMPFRMNATCE